MATAGALVVAERAAEEPEELPVDLSQLPSIPATKALLLVNNFVANSTRFLNHFAFECEERISRVSSGLTRVEISLAILEAKLSSIPDLSVSDADVQAAGRSMAGGGAAAPGADQIDIGLADLDLPAMDAGAPAPPPPPPPPPADDGGIVPFEPQPQPPVVSGDLVVAPPPPPPGSDFDDDEEDAGPVAPDDLPPPPEAQPTFLKLKDDPVYAKYFTMRRLGMPDQIIEHKLMMDGMDPGILNMDPEGPSPSGGAAPTASEPTGPILPIMAPPSVMSDSDSDDDSHVGGGLPPPPPPPPASVVSERPPSGNIGLPFPPPPPPVSPTSSVASRPESLFGGLPPPPRAPGMGGLPPPPLPPFDPADEDSSSDDDIEEIAADPAPSDPGFMKLKDDPAFEKYFKMRKLGMPDAIIQHKLMMDGVTEDILNMDPEGPSPNGGAPPASAPLAAAAPPSALPPPPLPPVGRPGLPPPPIPKYTGSDDSDFDSD